MMAFDPDQYLAGASGGFDPDAYLGEKPDNAGTLANIGLGALRGAPAQDRPPIDEPNQFERLLAKITIPDSAQWGLNRARGFAMGAADPSVGAFQLVANVVGQGDSVNQAIADKEQAYEAERRGVGSEGFDWARLGGNVASPVNLLASGVAIPETVAGRAGYGAAMGAAGGLSQPVTDAPTDGFWGNKAIQGAAGTVLGAGMAPVIGKFGDRVARMIDQRDPAIQVAAQAALQQQTDATIAKALAEVGQNINDLPQSVVDSLRQQVAGALQKGKQLDPAAILRQQDFESVGMPALAGQVNRDPMQFARELNMRGVQNVGEPIAARLNEQNQVLQRGIGAFQEGANPDAYVAGNQIATSLAGTDEVLRKHVSGLYDAARQSAGKDLDVPLTGLAQDYARILGDFGDNIPASIRAKFAALGLDPANPSNQKQLFTIEGADNLLKIINKNDPGGMNKPMTTALGELRHAVKQSVVGADASGGPFAPAVAAAAKRFRLQDAVPALKAAADGTTAPDDFIRRFVLNGKVEELQGLSKVLKATDPEAYGQARAQIGAHLNRAAFGENATGDKVFAAERFNKALRTIGASKMAAFFTPAEIEQIKVLGRVGAYIHQAPPGAAVNSSNTASAMMNLAVRIPGMPAVVSVAQAAKGAINNRSAVNTALAAKPVVTAAPPPVISDEARNRLSALIGVGAFGAGGFGGELAR